MNLSNKKKIKKKMLLDEAGSMSEVAHQRLGGVWCSGLGEKIYTIN
jgi:hypothetical protein